MMIEIAFELFSGRRLIVSVILMLVFYSSSFAAQLKFGDWVGIVETDPLDKPFRQDGRVRGVDELKFE